MELSGRRSDYIFDDLYRLTNESITDATNGSHNASFRYEAVGNRIGETINGIQTAYTYDANDRLTQTGGKVFSHDRNGNTLTQTLDGAVTSYVSAKLSTPFNAICKLAMVLIFIMRKDHAQTKQSRMAQFD